MSKWTKRFLVAGGILLLAWVAAIVWFVDWVSKQPRDWTAEASIEVSVPPDVAYAELADFPHWGTWSAWARDSDPQVDRAYDVPPSRGVASMRWGPRLVVDSRGRDISSRSHLNPGTGIAVILSSSVDKGVELETTHGSEIVLAKCIRIPAEGENPMTFATQRSKLAVNANGHHFVVHGRITLEPTPSGTRIRWIETSTFDEGFGAGLIAISSRTFLASRHAEILTLSLERLRTRLETPR